MVTVAEVKGLKIQELKDELKKLGLDTTGLKAVLAARLEEALKANANAPKADTLTTATPAPAAQAAETAATEASLKTAPNGRSVISYKASETTANKAELSQPLATESKAAPDVERAAVPAPAASSALSEADKRKQRAERFGIPASIEERKAARAERFGTATVNGTSKAKAEDSVGIKPLSGADKAAADEKRNARAKRFNLPITLSKEEIEKQKKARSERFGTGTTEKASSGELQAKLAARAERFALGSKEAPKEAPAVKAAEPPTAEPTKPLDPVAEAKRKAREIKFTPK